jgi:PucR family transcriptional regulator, purine catabolism regulatory protein
LPSVDTLVQERGLEPDGDRALRRAIGLQQGLAEVALEGRGLDAIAAAIAAAVEGGALVVGPSGRPIARHDPGGVLTDAVAVDLGRELAGRGAACTCIIDHPELSAGAYARPVPPMAGARARAWIVVVTPAGRVDESVRLVVQQAAAIVGLELRHQGFAGETERRLTAGLVGDAIAGRTDGAELGRRLAAFGIEGPVAVAVFTVAGPIAERALQTALVGMEVAAAVSTQVVEGRSGPGRELLCALLEVDGRDPLEVVTEVRGRLVEEVGSRRAGKIVAGVSRGRPAAEFTRTFQEACWALGMGDGPVGSWRDLGVESLLLAVADNGVLALYCDRLLGPLLAGDSVYTAELLHSLELFILHNGQWERAARELHCHRHTLRYRMRKVEELTGRDLSQASDRIEFWLALRAHELVARSALRDAAA